jgi:predicted transcriptional regulator
MASRTLAKRLIALKDTIEESKQELARCEGMKSGLLKRLKEEFGVSSEQEAERLLKKLQKEIEEMEEELEEGVSKLEEALDG